METETTSLKISFRAIKGFVNDLWYAFGTSGGPTPLSLYVSFIRMCFRKRIRRWFTQNIFLDS